MVKIVLPEGDRLRTGVGTKVFTNDGQEIENITSVRINISSEEVLSATIEVAVSSVENLEGLYGKTEALVFENIYDVLRVRPITGVTRYVTPRINLNGEITNE